MTLTELEKLADSESYWETSVVLRADLKQLIALVRLQHEALMSCSMGCSYDVTEVVAATKAYEAFEGGLK